MGGDDATRVFLGIILGRALRARLTSYTNAECNRVSVLQFRPSAYYSRISPLGEGRFTAGAARRVFLFLRNISPLRAAACEATRGGQTGESRRDARVGQSLAVRPRVDRGGDRRGLGAGADRAAASHRAAGVSDNRRRSAPGARVGVVGANDTTRGARRRTAWPRRCARTRCTIGACRRYAGFDVNSDDWWHKPRGRGALTGAANADDTGRDFDLPACCPDARGSLRRTTTAQVTDAQRRIRIRMGRRTSSRCAGQRRRVGRRLRRIDNPSTRASASAPSSRMIATRPPTSSYSTNTTSYGAARTGTPRGAAASSSRKGDPPQVYVLCARPLRIWRRTQDTSFTSQFDYLSYVDRDGARRAVGPSLRSLTDDFDVL